MASRSRVRFLRFLRHRAWYHYTEFQVGSSWLVRDDPPPLTSHTNIVLNSNILAGIGFSSPLILLMTLVQLSTPPLFIGVASALTISARTLGGVVGEWKYFRVETRIKVSQHVGNAGYAIAEAIYNSIFNKQVPAAIGMTPTMGRLGWC